MNESNWFDCLESNSARKVSPDKLKAISLKETAKGREEFIKNIKITPENASYIFENYYSTILELLHSIVVLKGYKIDNHICLGYYLKDILKREDLFRIFDDCRYKRNSLIYYGKKMDFNTAKDSIEKSKQLIAMLKNLFED